MLLIIWLSSAKAGSFLGQTMGCCVFWPANAGLSMRLHGCKWWKTFENHEKVPFPSCVRLMKKNDSWFFNVFSSFSTMRSLVEIHNNELTKFNQTFLYSFGMTKIFLFEKLSCHDTLLFIVLLFELFSPLFAPMGKCQVFFSFFKFTLQK